MQTIKYISFLPGGNKTALVIEGKYSAEEKKKINNAIMAADPETEQVGFLGSSGKPILQMAGGEFCGNAARSAAYYYLHGEKGHLRMTVNSDIRVACGVHDDGMAWCGMPIGEGRYEEIDSGICLVKLTGISHLVVHPDKAAPYLEDRGNLKESGMALIKQYGIENEPASGVVFVEYLDDGRVKINPVIHVRDVGSTFYETACGSGTAAAAIVHSLKSGTVGDYQKEFVQPSGRAILAELSVGSDHVISARIAGIVETDLEVRTIEI